MALRTVSTLGGNWNATTAWVGGVVPIANDTVDFTATSGNLTVNVATAILAGINFTNYVNTITFTNAISLNTSLNLGTGGYTQAGVNGLNITANTTISGTTTWTRSFLISANAAVTLTLSNNLNLTNLSLDGNLASLSFILGGNVVSISNNIFFTGNGTYTLNIPHNLQITNLIIGNGGGRTCTINGLFTLSISGNLTQNQSISTTSGTTLILLNGTGTWSNASTGVIQNNLTINTSGTLTISGNVYYNTGTLTYIANTGTVITTGSTLNISITTLNTVGMTWNNIVYTGGTTTITLSSNLVFIGTFTITNSGTTTITLAGVGIIDSPNGTLQLTVSGANLTLTTSATHNILNYQLNAEGFSIVASGTWNVYGNLIRNSSGAGRSAMGTVNLIGTGSVLFNGGATGALVGNININTLGTITFGSVTFPNVYYEQSTITYIGGTVDASNCNLLIGFTITSATTTLNTSSINWKNITLNGINTLVLTSDLNLTGNLTTQTGNITINGLFNVNIGGNLRNAGLITTNGTATLILNGTGTLSTDANTNGFQNNIIIKTNGIITIGVNFYYSIGKLTYITGKVVAKNSILTLATSTLINCHKINFDKVIASGTITMNEFLSGSPSLVTKISGSYTITFQDGFEKIAKFVNISGCTLTRPLQLLVLTKSKRNSTNRGIRYINQSPNGIAKGEPSVNLTTYGAGGLLADPNL